MNFHVKVDIHVYVYNKVMKILNWRNSRISMGICDNSIQIKVFVISFNHTYSWATYYLRFQSWKLSYSRFFTKQCHSPEISYTALTPHTKLLIRYIKLLEHYENTHYLHFKILFAFVSFDHPGSKTLPGWSKFWHVVFPSSSLRTCFNNVQWFMIISCYN